VRLYSRAGVGGLLSAPRREPLGVERGTRVPRSLGRIHLVAELSRKALDLVDPEVLRERDAGKRRRRAPMRSATVDGTSDGRPAASARRQENPLALGAMAPLPQSAERR
jgi:hypothetical protein